MKASTRSWLEGKPPEQIPVKGIRPTEVLSEDVRARPYRPILLVGETNGLHYIVDGNHRFFRKIVRGDYHETIAAWVLQEGDQERVRGNPAPWRVLDWKYGRIALAQLIAQAKAEYEHIAPMVIETLQDCGVLSLDEAKAERRRLRSADNRTGCVTLPVRQDLLERMQVLAQQRHMSVEAVGNDALHRGLTALEADSLGPAPGGTPGGGVSSSPGPFMKAEMNEYSTWKHLYAWAKRNPRLSPNQEDFVLWVWGMLLKRSPISKWDRQKAEDIFDKAARCGFKLPSAVSHAR